MAGGRHAACIHEDTAPVLTLEHSGDGDTPLWEDFSVCVCVCVWRSPVNKKRACG